MVWSIPYMSTRLIFFFSSRRRHTRYWRDWSSDVCSSDLQLQLAVFHRGPDILADLVKDLADFLDGAGAEGDADIVDAAGGMQVEIEIGVGAAEPADIDDAAFDFGRREILACDLAGNLVDDQVDAFAIGCLEHLIDPAGIAGIDRKVGAEFL